MSTDEKKVPSEEFRALQLEKSGAPHVEPKRPDRPWIVFVIFALWLASFFILILAIPTGSTSLISAHGWIGPTAFGFAMCFWVADSKSPFPFGVAVGSFLGMIDPTHQAIGLVGAALLCAARYIQWKFTDDLSE